MRIILSPAKKMRADDGLPWVDYPVFLNRTQILLEVLQGMYGKQLYIPRFTRRELYEMLEPLLPYYAERDRGLIADRVCETVLTRQKQG